MIGNCDVMIQSQLPITTKGKPQIVIFHGFLNKEDGRCTLRFTDIQTEDPCYICLGHDHVVYEPVSFTENVKIFRPGSLLRGIRNDEQNRNPQMLHIRLNDGKFQYKMVPIKCRDSYEIFKTKESKISQSEKNNTYDVIIDQIRNARNVDLSFEDALEQVTSKDVIFYIKKVTESARLENSIKTKNL